MFDFHDLEAEFLLWAQLFYKTEGSTILGNSRLLLNVHLCGGGGRVLPQKMCSIQAQVKVASFEEKACNLAEKVAHIAMLLHFSVLGMLKYSIGWRPKIENSRIWGSPNLRIAEFENRKTWELQDLRITGFENHRNWESNNLRNYDSLVGQITAEKMTSFKENYDVVLKSGNKDAIWKMLNDIFKQ